MADQVTEDSDVMRQHTLIFATTTTTTRRMPAAVCGWFLVAMVAGSGCRSTLDVAALRSPLDQRATIGGIMGPTERRLRAAEWQDRKDQLRSSGVPLEGLAEYEAAQELFDRGESRAAERAFAVLAKHRSRAGHTWRTRVEEVFAREPATSPLGQDGYGDPIEEDALFMVAESQFARKRYPSAQDSYGLLLEKYPSTRHLDDVTRRLFHVARYWLEVPQQTRSEEGIELVSHSEDGNDSPALEVPSGPANWPIVPNLFDRTQPVFDTNGRALQALESIWRYDATGPLADDALMLQATYHHRTGDFVEAARLYALVRETYPDSQHVQDAFILGSHVTLASYSGPQYEGQALEDARALKERAQRTFPNLSAEQRERLDAELEAIAREEIEREWEVVEFYMRKNQPASVALHCNQIINRHPNTPQAARAWEVLRAQKQAFDQPSGWLPRFSRVVRSESAERDEAAAGPTVDAAPGDVETEEASQNDESWLRRLLRPVERPPELRPVVPEETSEETDEPETAGRVQL